ncbi:ARM repeat-containing protein, partial [Trichodelitschia bisporula]
MSANIVERVNDLTRLANEHIEKGELSRALSILTQAASIDSHNESIKKVFDTLVKQEGGAALIHLCRQWILTLKDDHGEEALDFMHRHNVSFDVANAAMETMLDYSGELDMADQITGELLKYPGARKAIVDGLLEAPTSLFRKLYDRGDDTSDRVTDLVLNRSAWPSEEKRIATERDVFQLALAHLLGAGEDYPQRAMKIIARLLSVEETNLHGLIDADCFEAILTALDFRKPVSLRTQATIATAMLLQHSPEEAQVLISQFVVRRVTKPTAEGLILSFSAAATVFPMSPSAASTLFLQEGFLPSLVRLVSKWKSQRLENAALELLNAACIDKICREGIRKHCYEWLKDVAETGSDSKRSSQAALVILKVKDAVGEGEAPKALPLDERTQDELVSRFKRIIIDESGEKQDSVEGLAYASINPKVKEELASDSKLLKKLTTILKNPKIGGAALFGGLSIFSNLTTYLPVLTEEQKKLSELKAYANTAKPAPPDPLDDHEHVSARCKKVLNAGVIPVFATLAKQPLSPLNQTLILQTLNSLSKDKFNRGTMAQQGAVKLLITLFDTLSKPLPNTTPNPQAQTIPRTAAHALARILISLNPKHVFSSTLPLPSAIPPLLSLLTDDPDSTAPTRNLLPTFEGLLALTNLASANNAARTAIIRAAWPSIEDLLLADNVMVRRAATELTCNICAGPAGIALFADGSAQAKRRVHILLALADGEDLATRRAAGGALAMVLEFKGAVQGVLEQERGTGILVAMCADENEEVVWRGLVCLGGLVEVGGKKAKEALKREDAEGVVGNLIERRGLRSEVKSLAVQLWKEKL